MDDYNGLLLKNKPKSGESNQRSSEQKKFDLRHFKDASESVKKRESEVADLNGTNQKHNAIEPRILNQLNKTGRVGANPSILTFVVSWRDDYNGRSEVRKKAYFYVGTQVDTSEFQVQGGAIGLDTFEIWNSGRSRRSDQKSAVCKFFEKRILISTTQQRILHHFVGFRRSAHGDLRISRHTEFQFKTEIIKFAQIPPNAKLAAITISTLSLMTSTHVKTLEKGNRLYTVKCFDEW
ncbi:unnamed protein product [Nesidiocoris tenuis]|uniref:Uncharacterized protein n=1 Tax=Nesidiocoris tenuis TaxID=355587 RepID=A0A6H5HGJ4_9HEMI|nr:unnamed protein product [Nesidiocoris tenuis]